MCCVLGQNTLLSPTWRKLVSVSSQGNLIKCWGGGVFWTLPEPFDLECRYMYVCFMIKTLRGIKTFYINCIHKSFQKRFPNPHLSSTHFPALFRQATNLRWDLNLSSGQSSSNKDLEDSLGRWKYLWDSTTSRSFPCVSSDACKWKFKTSYDLTNCSILSIFSIID